MCGSRGKAIFQSCASLRSGISLVATPSCSAKDAGRSTTFLDVSIIATSFTLGTGLSPDRNAGALTTAAKAGTSSSPAEHASPNIPLPSSLFSETVVFDFFPRGYS